MKKEKNKKIILIILIVVGFIISFIGGLTFKHVNTIGVAKRLDCPHNKQYDNVVTSEVVYNGAVPVLYTSSYIGPDGTGVGVVGDANPSITTADGGLLRYKLNYSYVERGTLNLTFTYDFYYITNPFPFGYYTYDTSNGANYNVPVYSNTPLFSGMKVWTIENFPVDLNYYNLYLDLELSQVESNYELIFFHITPKFYGRDLTPNIPVEDSYYLYESLQFYEFYFNTQDIVDARGYGSVANSKYSILSGFTPINLVMLPIYELQKQGYSYYESINDTNGYEQGYEVGYSEGYESGLEQYERNNALGPVFKMFSDAAKVVFDVLSVEVFSGITLGTIMLFPLIALLIGFILKLFFGG